MHACQGPPSEPRTDSGVVWQVGEAIVFILILKALVSGCSLRAGPLRPQHLCSRQRGDQQAPQTVCEAWALATGALDMHSLPGSSWSARH